MVAPKYDSECIKGFTERLSQIKAKHIGDEDIEDLLLLLLLLQKKERHVRSAG